MATGDKRLFKAVVRGVWRFVAWWGAMFAFLAGFGAACPFCGQPGCPGGPASAGVLGGLFATAVFATKWLGKRLSKESRRSAEHEEPPRMIAFGPVPSRRLGRSLGVNNIPPKVCTYSCIYCQVGRTQKMRVDREPYYQPDRILREVATKVEKAREAGEHIDYLTFVPDGEPTLDLLLGREIELLRPLGIKIAVITNASLCVRPDVRKALGLADWVSLKVDSTREAVWRRVNHPHRRLLLPSVLEGMVEFARGYRGELTTETMLVAGVNDGERDVAELASFLARLRPATAYLAVPTRPPAEETTRAPSGDAVNRYYQTLSARLDSVELLVGYEGNAFAFTGSVAEDILSITAVHPMREDAVGDFLARANADWSAVRELIDDGRLLETRYDGHRFYLRRARTWSSATT